MDILVYVLPTKNFPIFPAIRKSINSQVYLVSVEGSHDYSTGRRFSFIRETLTKAFSIARADKRYVHWHHRRVDYLVRWEVHLANEPLTRRHMYWNKRLARQGAWR